ncbi:ATP-grasp domain-containing protein [Aliinostoc sp. HNIBRCY26]|uniref:ATP-grasp domain-containing protein n=1 Tax=Aliinostoc sp. HNIBRCY26 TaxID=3418997 RepID=UPI003D07C9AE
MNILILGNPQDVHAVAIKQAITAAGAIADYLDTSLFPQHLKLSWQPGTTTGCLRLPSGKLLRITDIYSVYWRTFSGVNVPSLQDEYQQRIATNDAMGTLRSLMQACPARWVNSWQAYELHKEKPLQLSMVKNVGVKIPKTLISNDQEEIIQFTNSLEKAIFKPVYGGAHTKPVTPEHLEPKRLELALRLAPVTIQEYIPGTNIRTYVIGDAIYSAEIRSSHLDFREDREAELIPVELPASVQQQCLAITKALMLDWTAIDWRLNPNGEYVFLEANPSPMFLHFENQTGFPITQKLVQLLMQ